MDKHEDFSLGYVGTISSACFTVFALAVVEMDINHADGQSSVANPWVETLSEDVKRSILWQADHEEGTLDNWQFSNSKYLGCGVYKTGNGPTACDN